MTSNCVLNFDFHPHLTLHKTTLPCWWEPCPSIPELCDLGMKIRWQLTGCQTLLTSANLFISKTRKGSYALLLAGRPDLIRDFTSASAFTAEDLKHSHHLLLVRFSYTFYRNGCCFDWCQRMTFSELSFTIILRSQLLAVLILKSPRTFLSKVYLIQRKKSSVQPKVSSW